MKLYKSTLCMALVAGGLFATTSCSNDSELASAAKQVPLQVKVGGVNSTRSIITGSTLPDECTYGIYAVTVNDNNFSVVSNGSNVPVTYVEGNSHISRDILLDETPVSVFAYYPYNSDVSYYVARDSFYLEADSQTDYLIGGYMTEEGGLLTVNASNPTAIIRFDHALARVTFRITKAETNEESYKMPVVLINNVESSVRISLTGDGEEYRGGKTTIPCKVDPYMLQNSSDVVTADFLVVPDTIAEKEVSLSFDGYSFTAYVPAGVWESGQQYTYNVVIDQGQLISISQAEITPWNNNEKPGIEVGDGNYKE